MKRRGEIKRALQRLVSGATPRDELCHLIETVVSSMKADDMANHLHGADAQRFVDVLDQVCMPLTLSRGTRSPLTDSTQALDGLDIPLGIRNKCVRSLYKMCAGSTLLPTSMRLELPGNTMGNIQGQGGFGIVSKSEYRGREVAVKALLSRGGLGSHEMSKVSHHLWTYILVRLSNRPNYL